MSPLTLNCVDQLFRDITKAQYSYQIFNPTSSTRIEPSVLLDKKDSATCIVSIGREWEHSSQVGSILKMPGWCFRFMLFLSQPFWCRFAWFIWFSKRQVKSSKKQSIVLMRLLKPNCNRDLYVQFMIHLKNIFLKASFVNISCKKLKVQLFAYQRSRSANYS